MNIILQEYENIIRDNNTAQLQLNNILDNITKNTNELLINEVLHGNLDFSILEEKGFKNIKRIIFSVKGEVTEIINLPSQLEILHCNDQFLLNLTNLPSHLQELHCKDNHINFIDLTKCTKLKVLQISNNQLQIVDNLPPLLEELYCNDNQIKTLNLINNHKLRVLHTSNNKTIIIIGIPPSIVDFVSENNPYIEINTCINGEGQPPATQDSQMKKVNYMESLNDYFKLKNKYEMKLHEMRRKAFHKGSSSINGKRLASRIVPKCIRCNKSGGTIFNYKDRRYTAVCGNTEHPCELNIEIYNSSFTNNEKYLELAKDALNELKLEIIQQKMDTVFNYTTKSSATNLFKKLMNEYNDFNKTYSELFTKHNDLYYGEIRKECIEKKTVHIFELILSVKKLLNEYKKTDNPNILKTAVDIQVKELFPEIHNLRMLKYEIMEMNLCSLTKKSQNIFNNFNEVRGEENLDGPFENETGIKIDDINGSVLVQYPLSLHKIEYNLRNAPPRVIKYN